MKNQFNHFYIFCTFRGQLILLIIFIFINLFNNVCYMEGCGNLFGEAVGLTIKLKENPNFLDPNIISNNKLSDTMFLSIDNFYNNMNKAIFDPFLVKLLQHLRLIESNYSVAEILQIEVSNSFQNEIVRKCYKFFPEPYPGIDFYNNSSLLDEQFSFILRTTNCNPLFLYSYATFVSNHLIRDSIENFGIYPSPMEIEHDFILTVNEINNIFL